MSGVIDAIQSVGSWVGSMISRFAEFVQNQPYIFAAIAISAVGIGVGFLVKILKAV